MKKEKIEQLFRGWQKGFDHLNPPSLRQAFAAGLHYGTHLNTSELDDITADPQNLPGNETKSKF